MIEAVLPVAEPAPTKPAGAYVHARDFRDSGAFDVCIIGSGAGGAVTAATLAAAGFRVVVLEEGGHYTRADFKMREDLAYPQLYQESGTRATKDLGIAILQGRAVGGTTVVNWTTSFRTPEPVLDHWKSTHNVGGFARADLDPHWDAVEARLGIAESPLAIANRNNKTLYDGCKSLGFDVAPTKRNVRACQQSGYCGMGCPVDAKQSMLLTYLPDAVAAGASVVYRCRVDKLRLEAGRAVAAECSVIADDGYNGTWKTLTVRAARFVLSAGAIGTPTILTRSGLGGGMVGRRTFLHPVVGTAAKFKDAINPFYGAPQSVASHHFAHRGDKIGFFLEAAPLHPMLSALSLTGFGAAHAETMRSLPNLAAHIALSIDGFTAGEEGGTVIVRDSGAPVVDYKFTPALWESLRESLRVLVRIDLAAGAEWVASGHDPALVFKSEKDLAQLDGAPFDVAKIAVFSAHVMGGAKMGDTPATSVVRSADLRHHTVANLHVVDGSVFPTSLGVNPQESIYGLAHLMSSRFVAEWKRG